MLPENGLETVECFLKKYFYDCLGSVIEGRTLKIKIPTFASAPATDAPNLGSIVSQKCAFNYFARSALLQYFAA